MGMVTSCRRSCESGCMGRFQEFTFGELASLGSGVSSSFKSFRVSGFQGFRVSRFHGFRWFQEFTFGELASVQGFQRFQCFRVIARRDKEATKVSMFQCFSVSKGFRLLKVCDIAERHMALYTEHYSLFTIHSSLFTFHFSLFTKHSALSTKHHSQSTLTSHSPGTLRCLLWMRRPSGLPGQQRAHRRHSRYGH